MNSVKKKLQSEGVLSIHLKRLFNFRTSFKMYNLKQFKIRIRYKHQTKESKIVALSKNELSRGQIVDELKLFSIKIVQDETDDFIHFDLIQLRNDTETIKSNFKLNMIDLVRSNLVVNDHLTEFVRQKPKNAVSLGEPSSICSIEFDSCFVYGLFGFGLSNRITFDAEPNQACSSKHNAYSLFKRDDHDSIDCQGNCSNISLGLHNLNTREFPLLKKALEKRSNFSLFKSEMNELNSRIDRLNYLRCLLSDKDLF